LTGNFEKQLKEGSINVASLSAGAVRETWKGGSFAGDLEGYMEEGSGHGVLLGSLEGGSFTWGLTC
jgi:hypothetical protein